MKTYAIITYAGTHYLITDKQNEKLKNLNDKNSIIVDGNLIMVSNICEIMTISKYYETYPNKRPQIVDRYKELPGMGFGGVIANSRETALKGMIKGIKNYITSYRYQGTESPKELLKIMEGRLLQSN